VGGGRSASGEGSFSIDRQRSVVAFEDCLAFPENVELESLVTFAGTGAGGEVRGVTPDPSAITLVQHQSFVALPDDDYRPREHDPRMGSFALEFVDFAAPLDRPLTRRWIARHRLQRADPRAASSPAIEPIVFYVDRGAPEPVRSALVEGASWWAKAFEAAGFEDGFRVEVRVILFSEEVLTIPSSALFRRGEGWAAYVLDADGVATARDVEVGRRTGLLTEVIGGVAAGDRVVLHPSGRIEDGVLVEARQS